MINFIYSVIEAVADKFFGWLLDADYNFKDDLWEDEHLL